MKIKTLQTQFVNLLPNNIEEGILYISIQYTTSVHLCPCGCKEKVIIPFAGELGWKLTMYDSKITLTPSLLNHTSCKSHYFIRAGKVISA